MTEKIASNFFNNVYIIICFLIAFDVAYSQNKGGRWQFENNGNDSSTWNSKAHNGFLIGSATYAKTEPLIEGNYYLSLENENDYGNFIVEDNPDLDFQNESIAISLWIYPVKGKDNPQFILIKGDRAGSKKTNNYALRINTSEGKNYLEFICHLESGTLKSVTSSFEVPENQWTFIALYYDYSNSKIYLWNKKSVVPTDTFSFSAELFPNNDNLIIGAAGKNGFKRFWGRIDDLRIGTNISQILYDIISNELTIQNEVTFSFQLYQNFPNPFNLETTIKFSLKEKGFTKLDIYNLLGLHIANLLQSELGPGEYSVVFSSLNLPSGVYFYKLQQGTYSEVKKMILIE